MTDYQETMLKLKMVELTQNQSIIALLANISGSDMATQHAIESEDALNTAIKYTEKILKI